MSSSNSPKLGFIGPGTVGTTLAVKLAEAGYHVVAVYGRTPERLARAVERIPGAIEAPSAQAVVDEADLVFLTVPDDAIKTVADGLDWRAGMSVVHCSGAASLDLLDHARHQAADVGVFHPLQTLASLDQAMRNLPGSAVAIEASDPALRDRLAELAQAVGGKPFVLEGEKALYHASAVIACNDLVTLLDAAAGLWTALGRTKEDGLRALLPLVRGTIENLEAIGLPNALTGPVARGDAGTVKRNLAALEANAPETASLYIELARRTIPIARAKGTLDEAGERRLLEALDEAEERAGEREK